MSAFTQWAQNYYDEGYSVIPLKKKDRTPAIENHSRYSEDLPSEEELEEWLSFYKDTSLGLVCGKASGVIALDFDYTGNDAAIIETYLKGIIPPSPCIKFGSKGWTAFYKYNGIPTQRIDKHFKDRDVEIKQRFVDILSDGVYTVLPPSYHEKNKKEYVWLTQDSLLDISKSELPELTQQIIDSIHDLVNFDIEKDERFFSYGGRHDDVVAYAWKIIATVKSLEDLAEKMIAFDLQKNPTNPYFQDKKYLKNKTSQQYALDLAKKCEKTVIRSKKKRGIDWDISKNIENDFKQDENYEKIGFYYRYKIPKETGGVKIVDVPQYKLMADEMLKLKNMAFDDSSSLFFNGKNWTWFSKTALNNLIVEKNQQCIKPAHIDQFSKIIRSQCFQGKLNLIEPNGFINVDNGIVDIKNKKLLPHSYQYLFKYCSPVKYEDKSDHPLWDKFLLEVFENNIELIDLAQRMFGYILLGGYPFLHKAFVLYGSGRNGKSTFLDVLKAVIGYSSYSSVSLSKIHKEFSVVSIDGKLANIVEETPRDEINAEAFKNMVGGGDVTGSHKGFDEYTFKCTARFVFACNEMPVFNDKTDGLEERLVFIPFKRFFAEEERDTELTDKLLTELSGILNWSIDGAHMILKDKRLPDYSTTEESKKEYKLDTDPMYAWFEEKIKIEENCPEKPAHYFYEKYRNDMESNGNHPYSKDKFTKRLKKMVFDRSKNLDVPFNPNQRDLTGSVRVYRILRYLESDTYYLSDAKTCQTKNPGFSYS